MALAVISLYLKKSKNIAIFLVFPFGVDFTDETGKSTPKWKTNEKSFLIKKTALLPFRIDLQSFCINENADIFDDLLQR